MIDLQKVKALAFDFGGTLDSPFLHWMDIYIKLYNEEFNLNLTSENFRPIYVRTERMLDYDKIIQPNFSLYDTQYTKASLHFKGFAESGMIKQATSELIGRAAKLIVEYTSHYVHEAAPVLSYLSQKYPLLLVSNYYGNVSKIVDELGVGEYFLSITDSTIENVRKPDPILWQLAIERAGFTTADVVVIGDSMKNDILPGLELGCQVIHGVPQNVNSDKKVFCIHSLDELKEIF